MEAWNRSTDMEHGDGEREREKRPLRPADMRMQGKGVRGRYEEGEGGEE